MTIEQILEIEPHLVTNEKGKIWLVPSGKYGWTSFPVGQDVSVKKERELPADFVLPEGITEEEKEHLLYETSTVFQPFENAVEVTPDEYDGLKKQTHRWKNGKCVLRTKTTTEIALETAQKTLEAVQQQEQEARQYLISTDYVGRKISEAVLLDDAALLAELKAQYAEVISKAKTARQIVNESTSKIESLLKRIEELRLEVGNED